MNCLIEGLPIKILSYFAANPQDLETLKNTDYKLYDLIKGYLRDKDLASLYLNASEFAFQKESIPLIHQATNIKKLFTEMLETFTDTGLSIQSKQEQAMSFGQICKLLNPLPGRETYVLKRKAHFWMYEDILSQFEINKILEIGIFYGGSTHAWRLRLPNAELFSLDINDPLQDSKILERCQSSFYKGSAVSLRDIKAICANSPFDIVIDDASHIVSHQIFTFLLFIIEQACKYVYIIEDIDLTDRGELSFMRFFQELLRYQLNIDENYFIAALQDFVSDDSREIFDYITTNKDLLRSIRFCKIVFYGDSLCIHMNNNY